MNRSHVLLCCLALATSLPAQGEEPLSFDPDAAPRKNALQQPAPPPEEDYSGRRLAHPPPPRFKAHSWEFLRNPDRYPSVLFTESTAETVNGHQDTVSTKGARVHGQNFFTQTNTLAAVLPLADWFSLTLTGGINLNEFQSNQTQQFAATVNDNSVGTYAVAPRFFLVGAAPFWPSDKNPDRWLSIGLSGSGSTSMQYSVTNSVNNVNQSVNTQTWRLDLDARLPLCDWYTAIPAFTGVYSQSQSPEVPTIAGNVTHLRSLGGSFEQRFYFVGKNLLFDDKGLNPERWTSLYLILGGLQSVSGDQSLHTLGFAFSRPDTAKSLSASLGIRLPMTSHATLRLEFNASFSDTFLPEIGNAVGSTRGRTTSLGGVAAFRYYVF